LRSAYERGPSSRLSKTPHTSVPIGTSAAGSPRRFPSTRIPPARGSLRAVQLLLGHPKLESTVRYLGIEVDDALR
jgi:hypothetical protein